MSKPILIWNERGPLGLLKAQSTHYDYEVWPVDPSSADVNDNYHYSVYNIPEMAVIVHGFMPDRKAAMDHCEILARAVAGNPVNNLKD